MTSDMQGPVPWEAFLGEVDKGSSNIGVVRNEMTAKACETKEGPNILDLFRSWPPCDSI